MRARRARTAPRGTGQSERSVTNIASPCWFRRNDELRRSLWEVRLAPMYSSGTGYLMPRASNSWLAHRATSQEAGQPPVVSGGRLLTVGLGAA